MRRACSWMFGAVLLCAGRVSAQDAPTLLVPGARVRIWSEALGYVSRDASLTSRSADSLVLTTQFRGADNRRETETARVAVARLDSLKVEVRTPRRGHAVTGAGIGFLVGAVFGAVTSDGIRPADNAAFFACVLGAPAGFWVGLIMGIGHSTKWVSIPLR